MTLRRCFFEDAPEKDEAAHRRGVALCAESASAARLLGAMCANGWVVRAHPPSSPTARSDDQLTSKLLRNRNFCEILETSVKAA
jgi:hypothetical protein